MAPRQAFNLTDGLMASYHLPSVRSRAQNHCLEVAVAAAVAFVSTMATTVLLLWAGVPLHYRPVPVLLHIALASLAAVGWAALWDGLLPGTLLLRHLRLGCRSASGISGLLGWQFLPMSTGSRLEASAPGATWSSQAAAGVVPEGMALVVAAVMGQGDKQRHDGATTFFRRCTAGTDGMKVENGGMRNWSYCTIRRRLAFLSSGLRPLVDGKRGDLRDGCRERGRILGYPMAGEVHQLPLWPFLTKVPCYGGMVSAAAASPRVQCPGGALAQRCYEEQQVRVAGDVAAPGLPPCCTEIRPLVRGPRRRFASQVHRQVLRVRIVGAEPEQLPADWQERVFTHFNNHRNTGRYPSCPADIPAGHTNLASGVAVRRGSIFMTVSLVQLPSHHDGDDGPGGSFDGRMLREAALDDGVVGHRPDQPASVVRVAGASNYGQRGQESDSASVNVAVAADTCQAPSLVLQQEQQTGPRCRALVRTISAGADGSLKHTDAPSAHGCSVDGRSAGADAGARAASTTDAIAAGAATTNTANTSQPPSCGWGHPSPTMQHLVQRAPDTGGCGLHGASPSGCPSGRRRIAGVWRAERHGAFHSASSASTPGNSNNPLHVLGPLHSATVSPGSPLTSSFAGQMAGGLVLPATASPAPGVGLGLGGSQPMRYTPMLSPTQQASICTGLGPYATLNYGVNLVSCSTEPSPGMVTAVQMQHRAAPSSQTHGSVRTGGGTASASMQVAQLLDAMQLRSRDNTGREARCAMSVLTAVSQLDGSIPLHLRQVLGTESWEPDEEVSSSWEVDGVYERPQPPLPLAPQQQQQQQQARRWAQDLATAAANGLFVLSDAPSPQQLTAAGTPNNGGPSPLLHQHLVRQQAQALASTGTTADGSGAITLPAHGASGDVRPVRGPAAPMGLLGTVPPGGATWASVATVWPSHSTGLAVLADRASLPVRDVAVKPILICKAPLPHAAAAGDLAASITSGSDTATATGRPSSLHTDTGPDVSGAAAASAAALPPSELGLSLICAPATVSELSVMLRYCGPASIFGEQTYLPVQLQLDSASPAVAAAIRLQAAASDRDRRGGGDTQAARDVAEAATNPLPAHAIVRTALAGLACPGVLYVELWHGPQLCACLPVLLLPESAASWAHEVCSLWQQQAEEGEAAAMVQGRAGAAAMPAAAHQVVEDLGGWLTYAAHKRYVAERAAAIAAAATATAGAASQPSLGRYQMRYHQAAPMAPVDGGFAASSVSTGTVATTTPPLLDEWFSGWLVDTMLTETSTGASPLSPHAATTAVPVQNHQLPSLPSRPMAVGPSSMPAAAGYHLPYGRSYDAVGATGSGGVGGACNRELFHDMMLQEGYNWLADCVEAGCCGLAAALMDSLLSAGCSGSEVLRTCRSADGLPLIHTATLSGNPAMMDLVWGWGQAAGMDLLGWEPRPRTPTLAAAAAAAATGDTGAVVAAIREPLQGPSPVGTSYIATTMDSTVVTRDSQLMCHTSGAGADSTEHLALAAYDLASAPPQTRKVSIRKDGDPANNGGRVSVLETKTFMHSIRSGIMYLLAPLLSLKVGHAASRLTAIIQLMRQMILRAISVTCSGRHHQGAGAGRAGSSTEGFWQRRMEGARRSAAAVLRMGDDAVMGLHSLVLRVNVLHVDGGVEERRFLSHFQQCHGWVFSAWCWSMIPVYALILWRYLLERQWGQLAWTPLWMWMYVVCAAADVSGATAAYRPRTEALAAAMHLSHTLSKALHCAGLPSYPVPQGRGRLYWMDVLACATLSAICEPVRICVAWPLRLINFVVSTVLYRFTGTAPTYLEAILLSASCHCFGLLMQHAVESHYRRSFTIMQEDMACGMTGAAVVVGAPKSPSGSSTPDGPAPCSEATVTSTGDLPGQQQRQQFAQVASPPFISLLTCTDNMPMTGASAPEPDDFIIGQPEAVATVSSAIQPAAAASLIPGEAIAAPAAVAAVAQLETGFGEVWEFLGRDRPHIPDCERGPGPGGANGSSGAGGYVLGARCLGSQLLDPREEFSLADGLWESSEGTCVWPFDCTPTSDAQMACTSASVQPSTVQLRPQGQLATSPSMSSLREHWRLRQQKRYSQARPQAQVPEAHVDLPQDIHGEGQTLDLQPCADMSDPEGDDGVCLRTAAPLPRPLAQADAGALQSGTTLAAITAAAVSDDGRPSIERSSEAVGRENGGCRRNSAQHHTEQRFVSTRSPSVAYRLVNGSSGGAASGSGSDSGAATGRTSENDGSSNTCSGAASSSRGSGRGSTASGGGRGSGRSLRQLVSRATGWVAGTFRRKSLRITGPGGRKASPAS
ncbi:hypothetical protein Vretimale_2820 [Volvox reticuliferus]|uniref:Uncharacterized protein n=1 Tax=Volvox reticuliferus TaxID=1737510 RepID=A0A8J4D7H1_9CHLO|nr:hypothetical protein Vretifemale_1820 [Volvox reticuliferus]GIL97075.1 hypothetical protein Vretimale_2820 [Volvox reticuliferus]